jgi:hypothetical protein
MGIEDAFLHDILAHPENELALGYSIYYLTLEAVLAQVLS